MTTRYAYCSHLLDNATSNRHCEIIGQFDPCVFPGKLRVLDLLTGYIVLESRELLDALLLKEDQVVSLAI